MDTRFTVDGNIISELSEKIPSNVIALNELIKNAYDAGSEIVSITISSIDRKMIIEDYGCGMDQQDITKLFHISNSEKVYGKLNEYKRYTQGSKGLGFLSVFKFGSEVTWRTYKDQPYCFSANFDEIIKQKNISEYNIEINIDHSIPHKGTIIEISLNDYNLHSLINYFKESTNREKVICSFNDGFRISLNIDGTLYKHDEVPSVLDFCKSRQLFHIEYSSAKKKLIYKYNDCVVKEIDYDFPSEKYVLYLDLMTFQLAPRSKQGIVDKLFFDPNNELTPLIYMNHNFFNNYSLFNPSITRSSKSSVSLPQMIGYVDVICSHRDIGFNSDRTQLLQNNLTDEITEYLQKINKDLQKYGSEMKKYLVDLDFIDKDLLNQLNCNSSIEDLEKCIKKDFYFKENVQVLKKEDVVIYCIFGKEITYVLNKSASSPASPKKNNTNASTSKLPKIILTKENDTLKIKENPIDLLSYISLVTNSKGEEVDKNLLKISVDNIQENRVLSSVTTPCIKRIVYSYNDGDIFVTRELVLNFIKPASSVDASPAEPSIFSYPGKSSYTITFSDTIGRLLNQLKSLEPHMDEYLELFSCACRAFFDLSCTAVRQSQKIPDLDNTSDLQRKMLLILQYASQKENLRKIDINTQIGFNTLKNSIGKLDSSSCIPHLGAHTSASYITRKDLDKAFKDAMLFIVICNEIITNPQLM